MLGGGAWREIFTSRIMQEFFAYEENILLVSLHPFEGDENFSHLMRIFCIIESALQKDAKISPVRQENLPK